MPKDDRKHDATSTDQKANQPVLPPSAKRPVRRRSGRRKWCFRFAALLLPAFLVVSVESLLVLSDTGHDLSLFVKVPGNPEILPWQINSRAEESYFSGRQLAGPEPKRFDLPRPKGVYRIVVVGGSTVLGFPYPPELSFPRQLEVLLNQQTDDANFEIINLGMVAINSFSVADVVNQAVALEPDLLIVHTGHNEFYGPGGVASTTAMAPLAAKLRRLRLFQLLASGFSAKAPPQTDLMEELPASVTIPLDGPEMQLAEKHYRQNLQHIVDTASSADIPVLLTTMASNLSSHSPVSFLVPEQLGTRDMERWRTLFDQGRQLTVEKRWPEALAQLQQAAEISSESSLLHYRMGQCLAALEHHSESVTEFERARDLDGCRFRAPSSFAGIVHDVAQQANHPNLFFIDSAQQLATEAGPGALGANLFLEHVHYNLEGHRHLAGILSRFVHEQILQQSWDTSRVPNDAEFDERLGLLPEDRVSGQSYALQVLNVFPMTQTFDVNLHREQVVGRIKQELSLLDQAQQQIFADLSLDDMAVQLAAALGDHHHSKQQFDRELFYRRCDQIRRPWNADVAFRLARCLAESGGDLTQAREFCERAQQLNPQHTAAQRLWIQLNAGLSMGKSVN